MEITIDQLIQWHSYFTQTEQSEKVKEIIDGLEERLHAILTNLTPSTQTRN